MSDVSFVDTTLRDGQQSLWALNMKLKEIRNKLGGPSLSDEELILRVYAGGDAVNALTSAGAPKPKLDAKRPLLQLIEELSTKTDYRYVQVRRAGLSLTLRRSG